MGALRRFLIRASRPIFAYYYGHTPVHDCPEFVLRLLGIGAPSYRADFYTLCRIVEKTSNAGGLIAECGVYRGNTLLGMAHRLREMGRNNYHLIGFDSFEGLPEPTKEDLRSDGKYYTGAIKGTFDDASYDELRKRISALGFENRITLVKGFLEDTLSAWADKTFALVHVDVDLYQSYLTCLEFFYPRVNPGGYIVFDEYDFEEHDFLVSVYPGARRAIDFFLADKPEKIQYYPEAAVRRYFIVKL